jgi:hypothetical protein
LTQAQASAFRSAGGDVIGALTGVVDAGGAVNALIEAIEVVGSDVGAAATLGGVGAAAAAAGVGAGAAAAGFGAEAAARFGSGGFDSE